MDEENRRIDISDLPKPEKELSDDEEKDVTGGGGVNALFIDGSVRFSVDNSPGATKGNTIGGSLAGDVSNPVKP